MASLTTTDQRLSYFDSRGYQPPNDHYELPVYWRAVLPKQTNAAILDIGCGHGAQLESLKKRGYQNLAGIDVDQPAVEFAKARGLPVQQVNDIAEFADGCEQKFDLIVMNHVLEHLPKDQMVATLALVRKRLLRPGGHFFLAVPNAQANTGCYWAYEDFTHTYLFTAGSLQFVLRAAGFQQIEFVDPDCTNYLSAPKKVVRKALLGLYKANYNFWNRVTQSSFYEHSPQIFSYEIKVLARSPNS